MSIRTDIEFRNANYPDYLEAIKTPEGYKEWEEDNGRIVNRPGARIEDTDDLVTETDDEYGGWIIAVKDIPTNATHIVISRG